MRRAIARPGGKLERGPGGGKVTAGDAPLADPRLPRPLRQGCERRSGCALIATIILLRDMLPSPPAVVRRDYGPASGAARPA